MNTNFAIGYNGITEWAITDIEALTEADAATICEERQTIKEHTVYFVDFGGYFKYSALVFFSGKHIHYANDYELHHTGRSREWLRNWYIESLNNKLFTDAEIAAPLKDSSEYDRKDYFLRNLYPERIDYVSIFCINPTEKETADFKKQTESMFYDKYSFCYVSDPEFIEKHYSLFDALIAAREISGKDYNFMVQAFYESMCDHEYGINWQADYDTLSKFGNLKYSDSENDLKDYFQQLGFSDMQKRAYYAARDKYYKQAGENNWI